MKPILLLLAAVVLTELPLLTVVTNVTSDDKSKRQTFVFRRITLSAEQQKQLDVAIASMKLQKRTDTRCESIEDAAALLWRSINIAGSNPAAAEYREFLAFSRLDWAKKDDQSFRSGFAVKKGTGDIYRWEDQPYDFAFIDRYLYLTTWTALTHELEPRLQTEALEFQRQLAGALQRRDRRAPSRFVLYAMVVQTNGVVFVNSELTQEFRECLGKAAPPFGTQKDGTPYYFSIDLYIWWEAHKSVYPSFPLEGEWRRQDLVKIREGAGKSRN